MNGTHPTLSLVVALASIGCTPEPAALTGKATSPPVNVVALAFANFEFEAPDTITAGWTTFHFANNSDDIHYAHFVKLPSGKTATDLVTGYATAIRTSGPRPDWLTRFGGPGGAAPGGSSAVTQYMEPGTYVLICPIEDGAGTPHFGKGEFRTVVVRSSAEDSSAHGPAPAATATIGLFDFGFAVDSQLTAGEHTIRVNNIGSEGHDLVIMQLAEGVTLEDVSRTMNPEAARRTDRGSSPLLPFEDLGIPLGGIAAIHSGMDVYFDVALTPGNYVLLCMATAPDGRSHIEHGMIERIRVQ